MIAIMKAPPMKSKPQSTKRKSGKTPASQTDSLEESYKRVFVAPFSSYSPARGRLTMYKSVPTVTTYGAYEKQT